MRMILRKGQILLFLCLLFVMIGTLQVEAKVTQEQKLDYTNTLSTLIREGTASQKMNSYQDIYNTREGRACLKKAVLENRAALMAEGIDALDTNWKNIYTVKKKNNEIVFTAKKTLSRSKYKARYKKVQKGLQLILGQIDPSMTPADKAMAVYTYLAKNTIYEKSEDCHSGYDVVVNHKGVCDGMANVYAMAMKELGIPCIVVSDYSKDHSWNMVYLGDQWYLCDLTIGTGSAAHPGMVVSYESCLVGISTFLKQHSGYTLDNIYGEGNSDGYDLSDLSIATSDYITKRTEMRNGLYDKSCTFYAGGYWYWISSGNVLKKSRLNSSAIKEVYKPEEGHYIGWIDYYDGYIIMSLNDMIYKYDEANQTLIEVYQVTEEEYRLEGSSYFWQIACVSRFMIDGNGKMGYYVTDLRTTKRGKETLALGQQTMSRVAPVLSAKSFTIVAGRERELQLFNTQYVNDKTIKWKTSDKKVAIVDKYGLVSGVNAGNAIITVEYRGQTLTCKVKVTGYQVTYKDCYTNGAGNLYTYSGKDKVTLKDPKRSGYIFKGWYSNKAKTKRIKSIKKGNRKQYILYAKWVKK